MVFAESLESWQGGLDHGDIVGAQDKVEDLEDAICDKRDILGGLFNQRGEDSKGDLNVSAKGLVCDIDYCTRKAIPNAHAPDIGSRLLLEKGANLLDLGLAACGVEQEVAQLATVRLDIRSPLGGTRIALEHEHLVLGPAFLLYGVHDGRRRRTCIKEAGGC